MAEAEVPQSTPEMDQENRKNLKYLEFVQLAAIYVVVCLRSIYEYAKENSGPLKPGVQTVEGTVKAVIGPVYEKFHNVPFEWLKFVDRKVDDSLAEMDHHVPSLLKQASCHAVTAAHKAPEVARAVVFEIQCDDVVDAVKHITKNVYTKCEPTTKELYTKYEPVAEHYAVSTWRTLNRLPLFSQVAEIVIPTAAHWSEKYNQTVSYTAERDYPVATHLPLIPKERIANIVEEGPAVSNDGQRAAMVKQ